MKPMIEIRMIREEDAPAFRELVDGVCRERKYLAALESPPLESTRAVVARNVRDGLPHFVAVEDGEIVGWCDAISAGPESCAPHIAKLGMGLRADQRGKGLGRRLLEATVARAREMGLEKIELGVYATNEPAIRLYRAMGFVDEGVRRRSRLVDGMYDDVLMMALWLKE